MRRPLVILAASLILLAAAVPAITEARPSEGLRSGRARPASSLRSGRARPASRAPWKLRIDRAIGGRSMGVFVKSDGRVLYSHAARTRRAPASNEKLLLSMALFDRLGPDARLPTIALARRVTNGVVRGDLFITSRGDPSMSDGGPFGDRLPFEPTRVGSLAHTVKAAGITRVRGHVIGSTAYFSHDWWAPGWQAGFQADEVALPSALTFNGNTHKGRHVSNPEFLFARSLTHKLEAIGVRVRGRPSAGTLPDATLVPVAEIASPPLRTLVQYMDRKSANFFAEVLGKRLGVDRSGPPGTIAKGAAAIRAWAHKRGVEVAAYDSSGLSYANRVSPKGLVRMIEYAHSRPWGDRLRKALPSGGQGTLDDRLAGVPLRAKTGTLENISVLSGWVRLSRTDEWAEFSIMSKGMPKSTASSIEDRIVRILNGSAH